MRCIKKMCNEKRAQKKGYQPLMQGLWHVDAEVWRDSWVAVSRAGLAVSPSRPSPLPSRQAVPQGTVQLPGQVLGIWKLSIVLAKCLKEHSVFCCMIWTGMSGERGWQGGFTVEVVQFLLPWFCTYFPRVCAYMLCWMYIGKFRGSLNQSQRKTTCSLLRK